MYFHFSTTKRNYGLNHAVSNLNKFSYSSSVAQSHHTLTVSHGFPNISQILSPFELLVCPPAWPVLAYHWRTCQKGFGPWPTNCTRHLIIPSERSISHSILLTPLHVQIFKHLCRQTPLTNVLWFELCLVVAWRLQIPHSIILKFPIWIFFPLYYIMQLSNENSETVRHRGKQCWVKTPSKCRPKRFVQTRRTKKVGPVICKVATEDALKIPFAKCVEALQKSQLHYSIFPM